MSDQDLDHARHLRLEADEADRRSRKKRGVVAPALLRAIATYLRHRADELEGL